MVTFSLSEDAKNQNFMMADDGDDKATAMAKVNTAIMVESNLTAIITPMFVEGAAGVTVMAVVDNMRCRPMWTGAGSRPMWSAIGATFMVQRATVGAQPGDRADRATWPMSPAVAFECADGHGRSGGHDRATPWRARCGSRLSSFRWD